MTRRTCAFDGTIVVAIHGIMFGHIRVHRDESSWLRSFAHELRFQHHVSNMLKDAQVSWGERALALGSRNTGGILSPFFTAAG